jgi:hypothetical protein
MNACIFGRRNATLDQHLRHIYVLDGVFASRPPAPGIAETREFTTRLKRWHGPGKSFRVYTQSALWWEELRSFGSPSITNSHGAHEAESPTTTVLHVPREYWANNWPPFLPAARQARDDDIAANRRPLTLLEYVYWNVHQVIPTTFMEHAVANTTFA